MGETPQEAMPPYKAKPGEPKEIAVEVVNAGHPAPVVQPVAPVAPRSFFHPLSGLAILAVDWLAFGLDLPTGFLLTGFVSVITFAASYTAVYLIQTREHQEIPSRARWKALIGGIAAGVPFPITGTLLGAGILLLSGLPTSAKSAVFAALRRK